MDASFVADYLDVRAADKTLCRCLSHGEGAYHAPDCPMRLMREAAEVLRQVTQEVA